jgi:hypothetical protein
MNSRRFLSNMEPSVPVATNDDHRSQPLEAVGLTK